MFKQLFVAFAASCVLFSSSSAATAAESPYELVKRISQEVLDTAKGDSDIQSGNQQKILDLVEKKILPHIDFEMMTKQAAAVSWRQATPEQQKELVKQFRTLLIYTYSGALAQVKDQKLEFKPFRADLKKDTDVEVYSQVTSARRGQPIELNYRLTKQDDGWKIYDISVLGAWLIETYKGNFRSEINKGGIDGLIKALADKNAKLANNFVKKS